eukprot:m.14500 g.14500  ORF g.14500 m.14500 type:complete len:1102 (+) comp6330_c0_seq1:212-3517(+)
MGNHQSSVTTVVDQQQSGTWSVLQTVSKGGESITVFEHTWKGKEGLQPVSRDEIKNASKWIKQLRHPNIIKLEWVQDDSTALSLITERVTPLAAIQDVLTIDELIAGAYDLLQALHFLQHQTPPLVHGQVQMDAVFIAEGSGSWKLAGFEKCKQQTEKTSVDCDALISLVKSLAENSSLITQQHAALVSRLQSSISAINLADEAPIASQSDWFRQRPLITLLRGAFSLFALQEQEQDYLIKHFGDELCQIHPLAAFRRIILPLLLLPGQFLLAYPEVHSAVVDFLSGTLSTGFQKSTHDDAITGCFIPHLPTLLASRNTNVRKVLLEALPHLVQFISRDTLLANLHEVKLGLKDVDDSLVSATLVGLAACVSKLQAPTVTGLPQSRIFFPLIAPKRSGVKPRAVISPPPAMTQQSPSSAVDVLQTPHVPDSYESPLTNAMPVTPSADLKKAERERKRLERQRRNEERKQEIERKRQERTASKGLKAVQDSSTPEESRKTSTTTGTLTSTQSQVDDANDGAEWSGDGWNDGDDSGSDWDAIEDVGGSSDPGSSATNTDSKTEQVLVDRSSGHSVQSSRFAASANGADDGAQDGVGGGWDETEDGDGWGDEDAWDDFSGGSGDEFASTLTSTAGASRNSSAGPRKEQDGAQSTGSGISVLVNSETLALQTPTPLQADSSSAYADTLEEASNRAREGDIDGAQQLFQQVVDDAEFQPDQEEVVAVALEGVARCCASLKDMAGAIEHYRQALRLRVIVNGQGHSKSVASAMMLGSALVKNNQPSEALTEFLQIEGYLSATPHRGPFFYNNVGAAYGMLGDIASAIEYHEKALSMVESNTAEYFAISRNIDQLNAKQKPKALGVLQHLASPSASRHKSRTSATTSSGTSTRAPSASPLTVSTASTSANGTAPDLSTSPVAATTTTKAKVKAVQPKKAKSGMKLVAKKTVKPSSSQVKTQADSEADVGDEEVGKGEKGLREGSSSTSSIATEITKPQPQAMASSPSTNLAQVDEDGWNDEGDGELDLFAGMEPDLNVKSTTPPTTPAIMTNVQSSETDIPAASTRASSSTSLFSMKQPEEEKDTQGLQGDNLSDGDGWDMDDDELDW